MRVAITSHGCRLNQFEGEAMARLAGEAGHTLVDLDDAPEVVVVNSCTITHQADADARRAIRSAARRWPKAQIVATGCYAASDPEALRRLPGVAVVIGNREKGEWLRHLEAATSGGIDVAVGALGRRVRLARLRPAIDRRRARAYLKIQDGCNYRCTFCVVPQVRGRSTSVDPATLEAELQALVAAGVPEVVLTGVHLGTYGWDLRPRLDLRQLLGRLVAAAPTAWLRLGSLDPHELDEPLLGLLAGSPRFARHLHLPLQSGDPGVLQRMRRAHGVEDFRRLVPRAAAAIPGVAIGTDVIVGFPGEDAAAFANTYELLEALPLAYLHVFSYSIRDGTAAATMPDQVPPTIKAERSRRLRALSRRKWAEFSRQALGQRGGAVVYRQRERETGALLALTDNYLKVRVAGDDTWLGRRVEVEIAGIDDDGVARGRVIAAP